MHTTGFSQEYSASVGIFWLLEYMNIAILNNKNKTLWDIIKLETGKKNSIEEMNMLNIKGKC